MHARGVHPISLTCWLDLFDWHRLTLVNFVPPIRAGQLASLSLKTSAVSKIILWHTIFTVWHFFFLSVWIRWNLTVNFIVYIVPSEIPKMKGSRSSRRFTADSLTCHSKKRKGVTNNINNVFVPLSHDSVTISQFCTIKGPWNWNRWIESQPSFILFTTYHLVHAVPAWLVLSSTWTEV